MSLQKGSPLHRLCQESGALGSAARMLQDAYITQGVEHVMLTKKEAIALASYIGITAQVFPARRQLDIVMITAMARVYHNPPEEHARMEDVVATGPSLSRLIMELDKRVSELEERP